MATKVLMYLDQNSIPLKRLKGKTMFRKNVSEMQDLDTLQLFTKTYNSECVCGLLFFFFFFHHKKFFFFTSRLLWIFLQL